MHRYALSLILLALLASEPAHACRCAQLPLERYFEQAEIVLVGEITAVARGTIDGTEALRVEVKPQLRQGRPFKGELAGTSLVTPVGSARCGVPVEVGELYVIFAARSEPDSPVAWFDSCGGSRLYAGGADAGEMSPFVGLPRHRIVPRLFELSGAAPAAAPEPGGGYHTSPACWTEPRVYHAGTPEPALRERVRISRSHRAAPETEPIVSPNGAYRVWVEAWIEQPETRVLVDVERPELLSVTLPWVSRLPEVRWINEKLLFLRVHWGRLVASDLLLDAERGILIYEEAAVWGGIAFEQYREQCAGQCPCYAVPGRGARYSALSKY